MTTSRKQRYDLRAEFLRGMQCPGCDGKLPTHKPIARGDGAVTRCSWGDTMTLLDDVDSLENERDDWKEAHRLVAENSIIKERQVRRLQEQLDYAYSLWSHLPEHLRKETLMLGDHLRDECSEEVRKRQTPFENRQKQ